MALLIGRELELAVVDRLFSQDFAGHVMLVEGAPGIGKTVFMDAVVGRAVEHEILVLDTRPVAVEEDLSFGALGDLLDERTLLSMATLPEPQRDALEVALLLRSPGESKPLRRAVGMAVLNVLRHLAVERPVLLAVDDAQWLDRASAEALRFAVRRLLGERVVIVLARRRGTAPEIDDWTVEELRTRVELGPLTLGAVHSLLLDRLGVALKRPELRLIHEWSRGNPLHVLELGRAYASGSVRFDNTSSVPIGLESLVTARVRRLPDATVRGLAAAAASRAASVHQLAQVLDYDDVATVLEPAVADGVVELSGERVLFTHPLLASAAYTSVDEDTRRALHAGLATHIDDPDERARHLAHAIEGPDEDLADALEVAAQNVFGRGSPFLAAGLAGLARSRTPDGREADSRRRAMAEAEYRFEAGDTNTAAAIVSEFLSEEPPGPGRASLLSLYARYHHFADGLAESADYLRMARQEAGDDPALRFGIEEGLAWNLLLMRSDLESADEAANSAVTFAEMLGNSAAIAEGFAVASLTANGLGKDGTRLIDRALDLEPETLSLRVLRHPSFSYGSLLTALDRFEEARRVFEELMARAESSGDESALPTLLHHTALARCLGGDLAEAMRPAQEAVTVATQDDQIPARISSLGRVALIHARRGDRWAAQTAAKEALTLACPGGYQPDRPEEALARGGEIAIWAHALAALSEGESGEASSTLAPMARVFRAAGYRNHGDTRFMPDTIEALVMGGSVTEASEMVNWMEEMPVASARAQGGLQLAHGLVTSGRGDLTDAIVLLDQATETLALAGLSFERGRALLALGKVLRRSRAKNRARQTLVEATDVFMDADSAGWAELARREAARVGGGGQTVDGFTETEVRVAGLIATGLSNKEVAGRLFISTKTVEATLTRLYAKIGIRSRTELVRWAIERESMKT